MPTDPTGAPLDTIELTFPASSRFIRLSRLAAATLAAELDFDVEAVDDVRIAVDELVTLLVEGGHRAVVSLRFLAGADDLVVEGSCRGDGVTEVVASDLVEAILAATTDEHRLGSTAGERSFTFTKRRQPFDEAGLGEAGPGSDAGEAAGAGADRNEP